MGDNVEDDCRGLLWGMSSDYGSHDYQLSGPRSPSTQPSIRRLHRTCNCNERTADSRPQFGRLAASLSACLLACFITLLLCYFVTLFVCLFVGLLVCWFVGLLVCWFVGLLVCWFVGLLVCLFVCLFVCLLFLCVRVFAYVLRWEGGQGDGISSGSYESFP